MKFLVWSAAALLLLLASCTQGTSGIFASVEREKRVTSTGGLSSDATVTHMAQFSVMVGSVATSTYFIAGGGALFHRTYTETDWHSQTINFNGHVYNHFMGVGLVDDGTTPTLYAIANYDSTSSNKLFRSTDGTTWNVVPLLSTQAAGTLVAVHEDNGFASKRLLLNVSQANPGDDPTYQYVYVISTGGAVDLTTATAVSLGSTPYTFPVTGATYDSNQSLYYFVNAFVLFESNGSTATAVTGGIVNSNTDFQDVMVLNPALDGTNNAIISSQRGALYWGVLSGISWTDGASHTNLIDSSSDRIRFGQMIYESLAGNQRVWIGTLNGVTAAGAGFASLTNTWGYSVQPPSGTDTDNYNSTVLPTSQILMFYKDTANPPNNYFAGTASEGLWKWSPTDQTWSQE